MIYKHLADLCDITIGRTPSRRIAEYWGGSSPWVSISDMRSKYISKTKECITDFGIEKARCRIIKKGTLLLSFKLSIGKLSFADRDLYTNEAIAALQVKDKENLYPDYLFYALRFIPLTGSNQAAMGKTLNSKSLAILKIPIPENYDDQVRIAGILSRAEGLIEKRKESIRLLDEFLKSTFLDIFGVDAKDYERWPLVEIQELARHEKGSMRTGPFGSNLLHSEFSTEGDVAVLGIDNAVRNRFQWKEKRYITFEKYEKLGNYRIFPGDVIITIMGTVGRSAVVPEDIPLSINTKHLAAITFDRTKANPSFISYSIHSSPYIISQLTSRNRGAIMNGLNLGIIKKIKVRKPPIELQNHFVDILDKIEVVKAKYQVSLEELERLYGSLSQRAFKGGLDLSGVKPE